MHVVHLSLLLCVTSATAALSANAWLSNGRARGELKLGLLPFLLEHAMLPGETRDVFLFDDSLKQCVRAASKKHSGLVGGLLMTEDGSHYDLLPVLRIVKIKDDDSACTWVRLACSGRCLLSSVRRNTRHGYRVAVVSPYSDDSGGATASAPSSLRAVHSKVASQRRELRRVLLAESRYDRGTWELLGREYSAGRQLAARTSNLGTSPFVHVGAQDRARVPFGVYESYESYEETGVLSDYVYVGRPWERPSAMGCCYFNARDLGELDDEENGAELGALVATRRAVLTGVGAGSEAAGAGAANDGLLDATGELWGVVSEEAAQLQLESFAAAATLGPMDRAQALMMAETARRLEFARTQLTEQQSLLTDLLSSAEQA